MSVKPSPAGVPPRSNSVVLIIVAVLLYGGMLLLGGKIGVPSEALVLFAGLWPPTCVLLAKLRS